MEWDGDSSSIAGGLSSPYARFDEPNMSGFRHRDRDEKSSPAAQTELSHFQANLMNDQIGTLSRELTKLRQEMSGLRTEVDNQGATREQSNGDMMKTLLEVRQAFTTQADALERELRAQKRGQSVEVEDIRATMQQNHQTMQQEVKRLCMAQDATKEWMDVTARLRQKMAEAGSDIASLRDVCQQQQKAHEALQTSTKEQFAEEQVNLMAVRETIHEEISQISTQMQAGDSALRDLLVKVSEEGKSAQSALRDILKEQKECIDANQATSIACFAEERNAREQQRMSTSASLDALDGKARDLTAELHHVDHTLQEALTKQQSSMDVQLAQFATRLVENQASLTSTLDAHKLTIGEEMSHLSATSASNLAAVERNLLASVDSESKDRQKDLAGLRTVLEENVREQFAQGQANLKSSREALHDEMTQLSNKMQSGNSSLQAMIAKVSDEGRSGQSGLRDVLTEQKLSIDATQAAANARIAEERAAREQLRSTTLTSMEALDAKVKELTGEISRSDSSLRDAFVKQQTSFESQQSAMSSRVAEHHAALTAALDACKVTLAEDMAQLSATSKASLVAVEKNVNDSIVTVEKNVRESMGTMEKNVMDSLENERKNVKDTLESERRNVKQSLESESKSVKESLESESRTREKDLAALRSSMEEKLSAEVSMLSSHMEVNIAGVKGSLSEQRLALERQLVEQRSSLESALHSLQSAVKDVDTQSRSDTVQLYNEYAKIQERVGTLKTSFDNYADSIKASMVEIQTALEQKTTALHTSLENTDSTIKQKLSQVAYEAQAGQAAVRDAMTEQRAAIEGRQASLSEFLEKECYAREAQHSLLKETLDQVDLKLRGIGTEQRDALQQLEQKLHKVRNDQRERIDAVESKIQEEVTALMGDHRSMQATLKGQFAESQAKVDTENASMRAQLSEEKTMRESHMSTFSERVEKLEKKFTSCIAQEAEDRENSQAALKQQLLHQENMSRDELKSQMQSEHTKLWDAVHNHTHDMTATSEKKVTVKKESKSSSNTHNVEGMQGFRAFGGGMSGQNGVPAIQALGDVGGGYQALPALTGGESLHTATTPRTGATTPTPGMYMSSQGPVHARSASTGGSRTPRTTQAPPTSWAPTPSVYHPAGANHDTRCPSAPRLARQFRDPVPATLGSSNSSSTLLPAGVSKVTTYAPATYAPAPAPVVPANPVRIAHAPVTVMTPARPTTPTMAAAFNTSMHHQDTSGMTYTSETVDTTDEVKKISCGPAQFPGSHHVE
mmetsp:Transcript_56537/g.132600  ORF Transcript_56537/g.132600 Transcript_56537/m.132600 type:complete len:1253 (-) Transcript_56537:286-4044(-)